MGSVQKQPRYPKRNSSLSSSFAWSGCLAQKWGRRCVNAEQRRRRRWKGRVPHSASSGRLEQRQQQHLARELDLQAGVGEDCQRGAIELSKDGVTYWSLGG